MMWPIKMNLITSPNLTVFFITGVGKGLGGELSQISHFSDEEMGSRELEWSVKANTAAWNKIEASQLDDF